MTTAHAPNKPKDWRDLALVADGRSLIEASAGTGKTWTIAILYLRLILEREFSPRQIVVTTFTDAAAQELRERLRGRLLWAEHLADNALAQSESPTDDETWLRARWVMDPAQRATDLQRLRLAIAEMDVAPVSTLHGLCRRILADHPFACGVPFVSGELIDGRAVVEEVARDLWRRFQQAPDDDALVQLQQKVGADLTLGKFIVRLRSCLIPGVSVPLLSVETDEDAISTDALAQLRAVAADESVFRKGSRLRNAWLMLADWIEDPARFPDSDVLADLAGAAELKGVLAGRKNDEDVLCVAALSTRWADLIERRQRREVQQFWNEVSTIAREQIVQRQRRRNLHSFDELLTTVLAALEREIDAGGERDLADALHAAWPVAMVDEFQDTDGVQYRILDHIYSDANGANRGRLILIGDPKQAIYRFRGGDIDAYRAAAASADADGRLNLDTNHRSSRALVEALNAFFVSSGTILSAEETDAAIRYQTVTASARRDDAVYAIDGEACAKPLIIDFREEDPGGADDRRQAALEACANQIVEMLQSERHTIAGKPVQASDIAVLLPTAASIRSLRDALRERGVPCVTSERSSVFDTDLARELRVILHAVLHTTDAAVVRAALATRLWGASFSALRNLEDDVVAFRKISETFRQWHEDWQARGIQFVVDALIDHMAPRYLRTVGGERAITDLRHLGELLQEHGETVTGSEELLVWFAAQTSQDAADEDAAEAAQLRIESDDARVRVMTFHASKGLEFPIVFLPLMWAHGEHPSKGLPVINQEGSRVVEISKAAAEQEKQDFQDERFRVLYVAMTRAIHACHLFALPPSRPAKKNSRNPLQGTARSALDVILARMQPAPDSPDFVEQLPHVAWNAAPIWPGEDTNDLRYQPGDAPKTVERTARIPPPRPAGPLEGRHSFTTLTHEHAKAALDPDAAAVDERDADALALRVAAVEADLVDAMTRIDESAHPALLALASVKGADFGNAIHAVFEHRDLTLPLSAQQALIEARLSEYGVRAKDIDEATFVRRLVERLQGALDAPLGVAGAPSLCLADLHADDLLAEMAFHFPLQEVSMQHLRAVCSAHGEGELVPHSMRILSGLMNGKIDLIFHHAGRFHVLDYKGNALGERLSDYEGESLRETMQETHYRFQALLYVVALDRYLRHRLGKDYRRADHLGECIYLFVRAAGLHGDAGIWRHRFSDALLDAVADVFDSGIAASEVSS